VKQFGDGVKTVVRGKEGDVRSWAVARLKRRWRLIKGPLTLRDRRPIAITIVTSSSTLKRAKLFF
jgi:hypothetical protein